MNKETEWICTDDDSCQYRKYHPEFGNKENPVYELYQIQQVTVDDAEDPAIYKIAHDFVYFSEIDQESVCSCYGFDGMDDFKEHNGDEWQAILAECQFELDAGCLENISERFPLLTWSEAAKVVEKLVAGA